MAAEPAAQPALVRDDLAQRAASDVTRVPRSALHLGVRVGDRLALRLGADRPDGVLPRRLRGLLSAPETLVCLHGPLRHVRAHLGHDRRLHPVRHPASAGHVGAHRLD